jgi:hypothetical protein
MSGPSVTIRRAHPGVRAALGSEPGSMSSSRLRCLRPERHPPERPPQLILRHRLPQVRQRPARPQPCEVRRGVHVAQQKPARPQAPQGPHQRARNICLSRRSQISWSRIAGEQRGMFAPFGEYNGRAALADRRDAAPSCEDSPRPTTRALPMSRQTLEDPRFELPWSVAPARSSCVCLGPDGR